MRVTLVSAVKLVEVVGVPIRTPGGQEKYTKDVIVPAGQYELDRVENPLGPLNTKFVRIYHNTWLVLKGTTKGLSLQGWRFLTDPNFLGVREKDKLPPIATFDKPVEGMS